MCRRFAVFAMVLSIGFLALSRIARADAVPHAADIAPYIDDKTIAVVRCDLTHSDVKALLDWYAAQIKQQKLPQGQIDTLIKEIQDAKNSKPVQVIEAMRQARVVYFVMSLDDLEQGPPGILIVPLEPGVDGQTVINLLSTGDAQGKGNKELNAEQIGNCVVGHYGTSKLNPQPNAQLGESWAAALAVADGEVIHLALAPGQAVRDWVEKELPNLPSPPTASKVTPVTTLTHGLKWASLSITLPPKGAAKLCAQAADADSAKAISDWTAQWLPSVRPELLSMAADAEAMVKLMTPSLKGDQLLWSVDSDTVDKTVGPTVVASLLKARETARRVSSMSNIRQLMMNCIMYADAHDGNYPKDLETALENVTKQVLINPQHPERKPGYIYISPGNVKNGKPDLMVIYESFDQWPGGVNAGFADGHVEWITDKDKFDDLLKTAKAGGGQ